MFQTLEIRAEARSFGSPLDPTLRISDADGKVIADIDDADRGGRGGRRGRRNAGPNSKDAEYVFHPTSDGEYQIRVRDLFAHGSVRHVYLLTIAEPRPGFQAKVEGDRFIVKGDKPLDVAVTIQRQGDFNGEIRIEAADLPTGVVAEPVVCASGATTATLKFKTAPDLKIKDGDPRPSGPFRIIAAPVKGDSGLRFEIDALWIVAGKP